jgi:ankyrin repeat protein
MQCQLRTQHLSTLEDADTSPTEKIQAALQLSSCSATGFGCKKNVDEALNYLQTSAEWGSFAAQLALPRAFAAFSKPLPKLKSPDAPVAISPESPYFGGDDSDIDIDEFEEDSSIDDQASHTDGESQLQGRETNPELAEIVLDHDMSESKSDTSEDGYNVFNLAKAIDEKFWRTTKKTQEEYYCWTIQVFSHLFNVANSVAPLKVIGRHFLGIEDESLREYLNANWKAGDLGHTAYVKAEDGMPLEIPLLHHAIGCCDYELVKLILKLGVDLASTDNDGHTPLHIACRSGDANITRILVRSGAKASIQDSTGRYPLHWLWMFENDDIPDIASILVRAGANVNDSTGEHEQIFDSFYSQDHRGTALHMAIGVRNLAAVRELLNIGADVNSCPNESMLSPLELATQLHVPEIVEELLCRGAKLRSRFGGGWALHHVGVHIDPLKR